ncbi:MAG: T9SS type A sorting domain-containing protein [Ignavibacteria bacterium]|nr:T9SS type A sorting domain-containing protein [Ignavibacteria bacterium]
MIPHEDNMTATDATNLKAFLDDGGNVYLQCHAIEDFENVHDAMVLTTTGISKQDDATYTYPNAGARMTIGQFYGTCESQGGSVKAWKLPSGGAYQSGYIPIVQKSTDASYHKVMAIRKDNDPGKGLLVLGGGHEYDGKTNLSRILLNAFLTPSQRLGCTPLPVELSSFSAQVVANSVQLRWRTTTEKNNFGFEVQRRIEAKDWTSAGFVDGHGTVNTPVNYTFEDLDALLHGNGLQYRLKQIDRDGTAAFSPIITVHSRGEIPSATIAGFSPNPASASTSVSFQLADDAPVSISIYDMMGRERTIVMSNQPLGAGSHSIAIDVSALLPGTYYAMLKTTAGASTSRLTISR